MIAVLARNPLSLLLIGSLLRDKRERGGTALWGPAAFRYQLPCIDSHS